MSPCCLKYKYFFKFPLLILFKCFVRPHSPDSTDAFQVSTLPTVQMLCKSRLSHEKILLFGINKQRFGKGLTVHWGFRYSWLAAKIISDWNVTWTIRVVFVIVLAISEGMVSMLMLQDWIPWAKFCRNCHCIYTQKYVGQYSPALQFFSYVGHYRPTLQFFSYVYQYRPTLQFNNSFLTITSVSTTITYITICLLHVGEWA